MPLWSAATLRRSTLVLLAFTLLSSALAASLAVHPFSSEDPLLGVAIADEIAASFHDDAFVLGPEVAAGSVPPLVVSDGFINLGVVLAANEWTGPSGPALLRSGTGVDVAISGVVEQYDDRTVLRLEVAHPGGTRRAELSAPHGERERLVSQAVRIVTPLLGLEATPELAPSPELEGAYADYVRAVALAASGLAPDALASLRESEADPAQLPERAAELLNDLASVVDGADLTADAGDDEAGARRLARRGLLALSLPALHESNADAAFQQLAQQGVALAEAWHGVLAADVGDREAAAAAFEAASALDGGYRYADALLASLLQAGGEQDEAYEIVDQIAADGTDAGAAALLGASLVAYLGDDHDRQVATLTALSRAAPFLSYPFQELSFLAFDVDDALAAAEALAVAVELDPESSLFWTNLGWANYLLGFLEESEEASQRALDLDANQHIAAYNLGLARAVTGRLTEALDAYEYAVALDPAVHDEVIVDLVNARALYPNEPAVEYALGRLYEAKGQRALARDAFQRFLRMVEGAEGDAAGYAEDAQERLVVLSAPPPPLEILGDVGLGLGQRGPDATPYRPGDPLFVTFELSTPGEQLPTLVDVEVSLLPANGEGEAEPVAATSEAIEPPAGAVGFVVDHLNLPLPADLAEGDYRVLVEARAGDELSASGETTLTVAGNADPVRQLFGRNVIMTGLEVESPLYGRADIGNTDAVIDRMLGELRTAAPVAQQALPTVEEGRFAGMDGEELFTVSTAEDVREFLAYVASTGAQNTRFTFVDGFAQWAIDGAPTAP